MKTIVIGVGLSLAVLAGCATTEEEETVSSQNELARVASSRECALGDGLYCGAHGVDGAANVLYRCTAGSVSRVAQCYGPCVRMPDGVNDKCNGYANENSSGGAGGEQPETTPPPPPPSSKKANWAACASDSECQTNRCGCNGGNVSQCLPNADYPKTCAGSGGKAGWKANWASCASDGECQTNWCGCNGANLSVCLPNTQYPKQCAGAGGKGGSKPNWAVCASDGECQTNWCGCNGGTERRCLPNTQYPKYCK